MRLFSFLQEAPLFIPSSPTEAWESNDYHSQNTIHREYNQITSTVLGGNIGVYILQHKQNPSRIIGVIKSGMPWNEQEEGFKIIFTLTLKQPSVHLPPDLQNKNVKQTTDVATDMNFAGRGLASFIYFTLADKGYILLSDENHLFGGIRFWRKMSRLAANSLGEFAVNLIQNGKYIEDKNGKPVQYDDNNYPKSKIWSTLPNVKGKDVTLVLQKK